MARAAALLARCLTQFRPLYFSQNFQFCRALRGWGKKETETKKGEGVDTERRPEQRQRTEEEVSLTRIHGFSVIIIQLQEVALYSVCA